mmetsp:Transcript_69534/g.110432  ORF Transcript_69534/g.110432 Transcript_69534/m.110432 type:complete len:228 (+) Transcript_69534:157-840(+)
MVGTGSALRRDLLLCLLLRHTVCDSKPTHRRIRSHGNRIQSALRRLRLHQHDRSSVRRHLGRLDRHQLLHAHLLHPHRNRTNSLRPRVLAKHLLFSSHADRPRHLRCRRRTIPPLSQMDTLRLLFQHRILLSICHLVIIQPHWLRLTVIHQHRSIQSPWHWSSVAHRIAARRHLVHFTHRFSVHTKTTPNIPRKPRKPDRCETCTQTRNRRKTTKSIHTVFAVSRRH